LRRPVFTGETRGEARAIQRSEAGLDWTSMLSRVVRSRVNIRPQRTRPGPAAPAPGRHTRTWNHEHD
jgi:hypothetical protein